MKKLIMILIFLVNCKFFIKQGNIEILKDIQCIKVQYGDCICNEFGASTIPFLSFGLAHSFAIKCKSIKGIIKIIDYKDLQ
jgi:hypothetical protein